MNGRCMNPNNPGDGNVTLQERLRSIGRTGYVPAQARLDMLEAADTLDAREAEIARLREVLTEFDRLSLVIESAVRNADPSHRATVVSLIKSARSALSPQEDR